jgi:hypothetical protein
MMGCVKPENACWSGNGSFLLSDALDLSQKTSRENGAKSLWLSRLIPVLETTSSGMLRV